MHPKNCVNFIKIFCNKEIFNSIHKKLTSPHLGIGYLHENMHNFFVFQDIAKFFFSSERGVSELSNELQLIDQGCQVSQGITKNRRTDCTADPVICSKNIVCANAVLYTYVEQNENTQNCGNVRSVSLQSSP